MNFVCSALLNGREHCLMLSAVEQLFLLTLLCCGMIFNRIKLLIDYNWMKESAVMSSVWISWNSFPYIDFCRRKKIDSPIGSLRHQLDYVFDVNTSWEPLCAFFYFSVLFVECRYCLMIYSHFTNNFLFSIFRTNETFSLNCFHDESN